MQVPKFIANLKVSTKINSAFLGIMIAVSFLTALSVFSMYQLMTGALKTKAADETQIAVSIINNYKDKEKSGLLSHVVAQQAAIDEIKKLQFGNENSFWIYDYNHNPLIAVQSDANVSALGDINNLVDEVKQNGAAGLNDTAPKEGKNIGRISYAQSIKDWNWVVGTGVFVDDLNRDLMLVVGKLFLVFLAVMPIASLYLFTTIKDITETLRLISRKVNEVALGKLSGGLPVWRKDEMGEIARDLENMNMRLEDARNLEKRNHENAEHEIERTRQLEAQIRDFEIQVADLLQKVNGATNQMANSSDNMTRLVGEVSQRASQVANASTNTSSSVQNVASATEEMSSSIGEISNQVVNFTNAIGGAINQVNRADEISVMLENATARIGEIVNLIQAITGQINLLALNATIESARAGEAGKGFAVVASEVKNLAGQTENATLEITENIKNIRNVSSEVICVLGAIKTSISDVERISHSISSSVDEQSAATREIAHNMSNASDGTNMIDSRINEVSEFSANAAFSAEETGRAAQELSIYANELSAKINNFLQSVRAA